MPNQSLVPLTKIKDILRNVTEENILSYEGTQCTQKGMLPGNDQEISIVELKIAFTNSTAREGEAEDNRGDAQTS